MFNQVSHKGGSLLLVFIIISSFISPAVFQCTTQNKFPNPPANQSDLIVIADGETGSHQYCKSVENFDNPFYCWVCPYLPNEGRSETSCYEICTKSLSDRCQSSWGCNRYPNGYNISFREVFMNQARYQTTTSIPLSSTTTSLPSTKDTNFTASPECSTSNFTSPDQSTTRLNQSTSDGTSDGTNTGTTIVTCQLILFSAAVVTLLPK